MSDITSKNEDLTKALFYIENVYNPQGLMVGLFVAFSIHMYFLYMRHISVSMLYVWLIGILLGYMHSYLRYRTFIKNPKIYADELDAGRTWFRHPIEACKKTLRFLIYEWYFFLFIAIMFTVAGFSTPINYFFLSFFLGLSIWGIFLFIFWKYWIRPKINEKYGVGS